MDEARLVEKLRAIEALFAGATTEGERNAAERAQERIRARLAEVDREDPPVEHRFTLRHGWNKRVFLALCRRYGLKPFRYSGQRRTTVMLRVPRRFVDETLWPEFQALQRTLDAYISEVTDRVVSEVLQADASDESVIEQGQLPPGREE